MFASIEWNWDELGLMHYIVIGGGVVLVLALLLYCLPVSRRKTLRVPAILAVVLGALAVGVASGALGAAWFGDPIAKPKEGEERAQRPEGGGRGMGGMPGGMGAMGGMPGGMGAMGGMPGGFGGMGQPNPKRQLASLVAKLDLLVEKPITLKLTDEQKKKVRGQLEGLEKVETLSDEEAKKRLDALQEILDEERPTLEMVRAPGEGGGRRAAGRPGAGGGRPGGSPAQETSANPFMTEKATQQLQDLRARLGGPDVKKTEK